MQLANLSLYTSVNNIKNTLVRIVTESDYWPKNKRSFQTKTKPAHALFYRWPKNRVSLKGGETRLLIGVVCVNSHIRVLLTSFFSYLILINQFEKNSLG